ncbi:Vitamin K-dependent protein C [Smittium mucronatum]|uniref:Vitamin K-dependent protein C n=1 Tax=Smittium mucronatum TaxID=133383 RepID=A0A1R0GSZ9_9FUNG|nr:Vitamin K-dependent protein C [Smittium mucronatum]
MVKISVLFSAFIASFIYSSNSEIQGHNSLLKRNYKSQLRNIGELDESVKYFSIAKISRKVKNGPTGFICEGVIYGDKYILTLASCVEGMEKENIQVSAHYFNSNIMYSEKLDIADLIIHGEFNPNGIHPGENNISILELKTPLNSYRKLEFLDKDIENIWGFQMVTLKDHDPFLTEVELMGLDRDQMIDVLCGDCVGYQTRNFDFDRIKIGSPVYVEELGEYYFLGLNYEFNDFYCNNGNEIKRAGIIVDFNNHLEWIDKVVENGVSSINGDLSLISGIEFEKDITDKDKIENLKDWYQEILEKEAEYSLS